MIGLPKKSISAINKGDIESHIKMIHQLAKGCEGKLCLCVFGEDPVKGESISPIVRHYEIGMVEKMLNDGKRQSKGLNGLYFSTEFLYVKIMG